MCCGRVAVFQSQAFFEVDLKHTAAAGHLDDMTVEIKGDVFGNLQRLAEDIVLIQCHFAAGVQQVLQLFGLCSDRRYFNRILRIVADLALLVFGTRLGFRSFLVHDPFVLVTVRFNNDVGLLDFRFSVGICKQLAADGALIVFDVAVLCAGRRCCFNLAQAVGMAKLRFHFPAALLALDGVFLSGISFMIRNMFFLRSSDRASYRTDFPMTFRIALPAGLGVFRKGKIRNGADLIAVLV